MSTIVRTDAVVLRSLNYSETSQIVTLFTRKRGVVSVIAKGARKMKSRFGASLQPTSYIQAVFYYKPTRGLQTLTETSHMERFPDVHRSLEKLVIGQRIVELVDALLQEEEHNPVVFNLTVGVLRTLNEADERLGNLLAYFRLQLASALGFAPAVRKADVQALTDEGGRLNLNTGAIHPPEAQLPQARGASRVALRAFAVIARADLRDVMRMQMAPRTQLAVDGLIEDYLRYHLEEAYPTRSDDVASQLSGAGLSHPRG